MSSVVIGDRAHLPPSPPPTSIPLPFRSGSSLCQSQWPRPASPCGERERPRLWSCEKYRSLVVSSNVIGDTAHLPPPPPPHPPSSLFLAHRSPRANGRHKPPPVERGRGQGSGAVRSTGLWGSLSPSQWPSPASPCGERERSRLWSCEKYRSLGVALPQPMAVTSLPLWREGEVKALEL